MKRQRTDIWSESGYTYTIVHWPRTRPGGRIWEWMVEARRQADGILDWECLNGKRSDAVAQAKLCRLSVEKATAAKGGA